MIKRATFVFAAFVTLAVVSGATGETSFVRQLRVTMLSTMLTEFRGIGEWGFSALVEVDGHRILFDTGGRPDAVLRNAAELGIDLTTVDTVVLSHNHWDHTGGLVTLRRDLSGESADAMRTAHVGEGMFLDRQMDFDPKSLRMSSELLVDVRDIRVEYEALGGSIVVHSEPAELLPGVWVTGPIPRTHPEKNWSPIAKLRKDGQLVEDTIPEDQALVVNTAEGAIVVAGCGHAGMVNTMEYAAEITGADSVHAVMGGFHLLALPDDKIAWTGRMMREMGVVHLIGAHCTGINAVTVLRNACELERRTALVGAVGTVFTLADGIQQGMLNR